MTNTPSPNNKPPAGAPEGTVWFGGSIDRSVASLRIFGSDIDPSEVSEILGCAPTSSGKTGELVQRANGKSFPVREGYWRLESSKGSFEIEELVLSLLNRLTADMNAWSSLTSRFKVDIFCGLFLEAANRGFSLSPAVLKQLSDRGIPIGFDVYAPGPLAGEP
jgi:hypothetical protein